MKRIQIFALASLLALSTTGCGKSGMMALMAGLQVVTASVYLAGTAASIDKEQQAHRERERERAYLDAERAYLEAERAKLADERAAAARAATPAPPVVIVVEPAESCPAQPSAE